MSIKVGLQYIEKWKESLELQVCRYEEEPVVKGQIVFYGASNFTRWSARWEHTPLREALPGKSGAPCAVNRGFGSSCAEHQLYYYPRMVRPLAPKVLVYSPFGNFRAFGYTLEELDVIYEQWSWIQESPNVLGGYYTSRYLTTALNQHVLQGVNARVALEDAIKEINKEMLRKQTEYRIAEKGGSVLRESKSGK